jgi:predicted phage tail protein
VELPGTSNLFGSMLFGTIGFAAFIYGKKAMNWKPMVIGGALMGFTFFVSQTWLVYLLGAGLSAALFIFRD